MQRTAIISVVSFFVIDFAGHLAHNTNLSLKAIIALRAYAKMCEMSGKKDDAAEYRQLAEGFVKQ